METDDTDHSALNSDCLTPCPPVRPLLPFVAKIDCLAPCSPCLRWAETGLGDPSVSWESIAKSCSVFTVSFVFNISFVFGPFCSITELELLATRYWLLATVIALNGKCFDRGGESARAVVLQ